MQKLSENLLFAYAKVSSPHCQAQDEQHLVLWFPCVVSVLEWSTEYTQQVLLMEWVINQCPWLLLGQSWSCCCYAGEESASVHAFLAEGHVATLQAENVHGEERQYLPQNGDAWEKHHCFVGTGYTKNGPNRHCPITFW